MTQPEISIERCEGLNREEITFRLLKGDQEIARRAIRYPPTDDDVRALRNAQMFMRHHDHAVLYGFPTAAEVEFSLAAEQLFGEEVRPWLPQ
jgi:hypothetical protein